MKNIDIIGACCDLGVMVDGASKAPEILEKLIDKNKYNEIFNIMQPNTYVKEKEPNNKKRNLNAIIEYNTQLYNKVREIVKSNHFPFTIGGDHVIAIASALASIRENNNMGIIWFDAHGDYHKFSTTQTGNLHGLPFACVTGYEPDLLADFHEGNPRYNPKNAVLLGGRDIDLPDELNNLKDAGVTIFTTEDIHREGTKKIYHKAFEIASNGTNGVHISYDIDVIDPTLAKGVSVPAKDGITIDEAYEFAKYLTTVQDKILSMDLVEYNPLRDDDKSTLEIVKNILNILFDGFNK
jgi:arginase